MRQKFLIGAVLAMGVAGSLAHATLYLQDGGGLNTKFDGTGTAYTSLTNGDKVFSNFTCQISGPFGSASPVDCNRITVSPDVDTSNNLGIVFQAGFSAIAPPANSSVDILLNYTVTAPGALITDLHMVFNGEVTGDGFVNVIETATNNVVGGVVVGQIKVQNPPPILEAAANVTGGPYTSLKIKKDIFLQAFTTGSATFSAVGQYFSQVVPEPGSIVLFGSALIGCLGLLRRRLSRSS